MSSELLHVYVIEDENHTVKIGIAGNVTKRISAINQAIGYEIINQYESPTCANARKIEKTAHKHFKDRRKKGEWFTVPFDEAVAFVKGHFVDTQLALPIERPTEVTINNHQLPILIYKNQRVATFAMIDQVHERPEGTARKRFNDNRRHFVENEDYFKVCASEIRTQKIMELSPKAHENITFLTQMGYLMLVKSFTDDLAWQVQRQLVNGYFNQTTQPTALTPEIELMIEAKVRDAVSNALAKPKPVEPPVEPIKLSEFDTQALEQMDAWINTHIVFEPDAQTKIGRAYEDDDGNYKNADKWLYASYRQFCKTQNAVPISIRRFSELLALNQQCQQHNVMRLPRASNGVKLKGLKLLYNCTFQNAIDSSLNEESMRSQ